MCLRVMRRGLGGFVGMCDLTVLTTAFGRTTMALHVETWLVQDESFNLLSFCGYH